MMVKKMEELVLKMANIYKERHQQKKLARNVWRGTSKNCSAEFEDLLGQLVGEILGDDYYVLVSYNISIFLPEDKWIETKRKKIDGTPVMKKNVSREPDILIYHKESKEIKGILDLKNDVGYTGADWVKQANKTIELLKQGTRLTYNPKDQDEKVEIYSPEQFYYGFVILNLENEHDKLPKYLAEMKKANLSCYILNHYVHLNNYEKVTAETLSAEENLYNWKELIKDIEALKE